jgi:hypothetical protein
MFNDKFDELFGVQPEKTRPVQVSTAPELSRNDIEASSLPENEFDPVVEPDPEAIPEEPDPFARLVDQMLESEGVDVALEKRRKYDPTKRNIQEHDWDTAKDTIYSDESYKFRCKRCLKWLVVGREETMAEVMERDQVSPNCAETVVLSVMNEEED